MKHNANQGKTGLVVIFTLIMGLAGTACLSLKPSDPSQGSDWPHWRGPNFDGISVEKNWQTEWPAEGPPVVWKSQLGTGFSSVSISKGRLYSMGNKNDQDTVYCLDAKTGNEIWKYSYPSAVHAKSHEGGPAATPTIDGNLVYTLSKHGDVFCLDPQTSKVVWRRNFQKDLGAKMPKWGFSGSGLIYKNLIIFEAGPIVAYDKKTGEMAWKSKDYVCGYSSPIIYELNGKPCVALFSGSGLVLVDVDDGHQLIEPFPWGKEINNATPIIVGNRLFISSGYNQGAALLEPVDGKWKEIWKNKNMRNHMSSSVILDGMVYGFDDSDLRCIDLNTGEPKWTQTGLGKGSLTMADGKLIILGEKSELVIAEATPTGYKEISRAQPIGGKSWTVPVLSHKKIYCRNAAGDLVCVSVDKIS